MKLLSILFLLFPISLLQSQLDTNVEDLQLENFVYQEFEQLIMGVWLDSKERNIEGIYNNQKAIKKEWEYVKSELEKLNPPHVDVTELIADVSGYLKLIYQCIGISDFENLENLSYLILYDFRAVRQCYFYNSYPLDQLWDVIDVYNEIDFTIDDPMMNLKEWFEFEDMINLLVCNWETYEFIHIDNIKQYYPGVNKVSHKSATESVNNCILLLFEAIETSFQDKFVLPCDELGNSLIDVIRVYKNAKPSSLL